MSNFLVPLSTFLVTKSNTEKKILFFDEITPLYTPLYTTDMKTGTFRKGLSISIYYFHRQKNNV